MTLCILFENLPSSKEQKIQIFSLQSQVLKILTFDKMIFKNTSSAFKSLHLLPRFAFGGHAHKVTNVIQSKHNPQQIKELRGNQQLEMHMTEYTKTFYYIHSKQRKLLSLYNLFSHLPSGLTNQFANLVQDSQASIASDQIFLPKIAENSVPVYESVGQFPVTLRIINKFVLALPFMALATAVMPYIAFTAIGLHYFMYFKSSFGKATDRLVIKMQLLPETEELVFQKITRTGGIKTVRVRTNDVQMVDPEVDPTKYSRDLIFERSIRSSIDLNMIFRVKSTGQILMFDREGVWHEEGFNHELMP